MPEPKNLKFDRVERHYPLFNTNKNCTLDHGASNSRYLLVLYILRWLLIMRNESTLFYSVSQVNVLNEIYWQKGPVTLKNSTGHRPGGQHYCRTLTLSGLHCFQNWCQVVHPSIHASVCQKFDSWILTQDASVD